MIERMIENPIFDSHTTPQNKIVKSLTRTEKKPLFMSFNILDLLQFEFSIFLAPK